MSSYRIENKHIVDAEVEAAFKWYESEEPGLGYEFLDELRAAYHRIQDEPLKYQLLRSGIRRAMTRRFPYAIYSLWREKSSPCWRCFTPRGIRQFGSGGLTRTRKIAFTARPS